MAYKIIFDLFTYSVIYFSVNFIVYKNEALIKSNPFFLIIVLLAIFIGSLLTNQYSLANHYKFYEYAKKMLTSLIISLTLITFYFVFEKDINPYINIIIVSTLSLGFLIKLLLLFLNSTIKSKSKELFEIEFSPLIFNIEFILLIAIVFYTYLIRTNLILFSKDYISILIFLITWFIASILIHQFKKWDRYKNFWQFIWQHFKAYVLIVFIFSLTLFILEDSLENSAYPVCISIVFGFTGLMLNTFAYLLFKEPTEDIVKHKFLRASEVFDEPLLKYIDTIKNKYYVEKNIYNPYLSQQLAEVYLRKFPKVFDFLNETLDLFSFDFRRCVMHRSSDTYNVEVLPEDSLELYMNLHKINDMRRINSYLIQVNSKLLDGGVFVGNVEPNNLRRKRFITKYPYYLAMFFYFLDFIWNRAIPKLPAVKHIYFSITKGKNRAISLSEILGRLYYCGFEVINIKEIEHLIYFIAKKIKSPLSDDSPSYGLLIKLKRVAKDGKIIKVYKFRTMYPYSEYLQRFVYEKVHLDIGGKFKDDFRVTSWGKFLRKLWLDELPMLINFFKGELKLIGVRPLSLQYFYLYDEQLRNRRIKYKPGLIPPFYYDLPKTLDEIMESEKKYLDSYDKHPILTDIKYFIVCSYNILINKARSA